MRSNFSTVAVHLASLLNVLPIMTPQTAAGAESSIGSIKVGSLSVYPELQAAYVRDSNIALESDALRESDTIWYLRPGLRLEGISGVDEFGLSYHGDFARYGHRTSDNFNGHNVAAKSALALNVRNHLSLGINYQDSVDGRGTLNLAATPTPNQWHESSATGLYAFGADGARGRIELEAAYYDRRYVNNRSLTTQLDHSRLDYGGTFFLRLRPTIYATIDLKQSGYGYKDPSSTLDSKDTFALMGLRWDATAITTGNFSIGTQRKRFNAAENAIGRRDWSGVAWDGSVRWRPISYWEFILYTHRRTYDATGLGDFTVSRKYEIQWNHEWLRHVTSSVIAGRTTDSFANAPVASTGGADREDATHSIGLRLKYDLVHNVSVGAEFYHTVRASNDINFDYRRDLLNLFVTGTL